MSGGGWRWSTPTEYLCMHCEAARGSSSVGLVISILLFITGPGGGAHAVAHRMFNA